MINYRKLNKNCKSFFTNLIINEGKQYENFLNIGWSENQIIKQLNKDTNLSYGAFYKETLVSFILGDLFNIEKISEYEILLLYVCKHFRNKGLGKKLIHLIEENNSCLKKIYLEVSKNNSKAISFYTKMKFKITYKRKKYFLIKNKRFDALVLTRSY